MQASPKTGSPKGHQAVKGLTCLPAAHHTDNLLREAGRPGKAGQGPLQSHLNPAGSPPGPPSRQHLHHIQGSPGTCHINRIPLAPGPVASNTPLRTSPRGRKRWPAGDPPTTCGRSGPHRPRAPSMGAHGPPEDSPCRLVPRQSQAAPTSAHRLLSRGHCLTTTADLASGRGRNAPLRVPTSPNQNGTAAQGHPVGRERLRSGLQWPQQSLQILGPTDTGLGRPATTSSAESGQMARQTTRGLRAQCSNIRCRSQEDK
ncbi:hypothetical protein NDU88_004845 [Pleurodeles waltl]|uniref:Uncharacterized protein n=1 Tax=Pleurodeles waltl TaxID=8319 RepID=A0AAV7WTK7_PLEWA|nr:hypothetical protein NDU88_004845 [Pleurodeles waltl]